MKFLLAAILSLRAGAALADDVMWSTDYTVADGSSSSMSQAIATPDGGALAAYWTSYDNKYGTDYSTYVVKFSSTGVFEWDDGFGGARGASLGFDSLGNLYVTIYPTDPFTWMNLVARTRKYDPNGGLLWEYAQQPHSSKDMLVEEDGSWYLAGYEWGEGGTDSYVRKIDPAGNLIWERDGLGANSLERDRSGNIVVLGWQTMTVLDENGNTLRSLSLPTWDFTKGKTAFGPQNEVYVANALENYNVGVVRSYDTLGNLRWERTFPSRVASVDCDGSKVYVATSASAHWLDLSGNVLYEATIYGSNDDLAVVSSLDGLGNYWTMRRLYSYNYARLLRLKQGVGMAAVFPMHVGDLYPKFAVGRGSDLFTAQVVCPDRLLRVIRYRIGIDHDSAQLVRGRTTENSHWAIMHSSDGYWSIAPGPVFTNQQNPISMIVKHTAPPENPTEMGVTLESRGSVNGVKQSVQVYNFSTSTWTSLESNVVLPFGGAADRYAILPVPNPVNHIGPGREIRLRVEYRNDSPVFVWPWTARIDREMIRYVK